MRTTVTLDEDIAAKLKAETRCSGKSFKETLNETLRRGLTLKRTAAAVKPFRILARDLGELRAGLSLDNVGELLEQIEGQQHR